jgi:hypothetical protein
MRRKRRRSGKYGQPEFAWEAELEMALRQAPPEYHSELLSWLQRWRRHPDRVFWLVEGDGRRRRLS